MIRLIALPVTLVLLTTSCSSTTTEIAENDTTNWHSITAEARNYPISDWRSAAGPLISLTPTPGVETTLVEGKQSCGIPNTEIALEAEADFVASITKSETVNDIINRMPENLHPPLVQPEINPGLPKGNMGNGSELSLLMWEFKGEGIAVTFIDNHVNDATVSTRNCGFSLNFME